MLALFVFEHETGAVAPSELVSSGRRLQKTYDTLSYDLLYHTNKPRPANSRQYREREKCNRALDEAIKAQYAIKLTTLPRLKSIDLHRFATMSGASPDSAHDSPSSTLPDVATWGFDPEGTKGDFARLIPMSPLARTAFNEVVRKLCDRPDALGHARQFIHFEPVDAPDNEECGDETPRRETTVQRWCGYYRLNMGILPNNLNLGWVVGSSRPNPRENDVDLLLTAQPLQHHVRGRHARFTHNRETGVLLVSADTWMILVNGTIELRNTAFAICERTGLMFGDLSYTVELTDLDPETYQRQLREVYPQGRQPGPVLPNFLTPTPTPSLRASAVNKYYVAPARTGGVSSTVSHAFVMSTGASVAMKRMKRGPNNFASIKKEVELLQSVNHVRPATLVSTKLY